MEDGLVAVACMSLADGRIPEGMAGAWLVRYDPEGNDGTGDALWSHDPADAARFTVREWAELYTASPKCRPLRPDGKPNRPITALTTMVVPVYPGRLPSILPDRAGMAPMTDAEFMARFAEAARAPASPPRPVESEADFLVRLRQVRLDAEAEMEAAGRTRADAGGMSRLADVRKP